MVLPEGPRLGSHDVAHDFFLAATAKGSASDQQFVEHNPQAENIAAAVDVVPFTPRLFGTRRSVALTSGFQSWAQPVQQPLP